MFRMKHGWRRMVSRMVLVLAGGVLAQATTCTADPTQYAGEFFGAFVNTVVTSYVNNQLGVTGSFFF